MQQALKGTSTAMTQASAAGSKFSTSMNKVATGTTAAGAGLKRTRLGLSGVGTGAFVAGAALTAGFLKPLKSIISSAGAFQSAMNLVSVLTSVDKTSTAFTALEAKAKELGVTTQFTAVQAAEGMQFLAKTGLEANEVLTAIPSTLALAAAASIDLGRASDITTNILKGFRLSLEDLPGAVDILAATFSSSNTDIEQLAASFKKAGPVAAEFGQEFKDVAAVIGALGDAGIQAEESGVALRRMFINLQNDAAKSNSILRKFGISIQDDVTGQMRPLIDIFKDIEKAPLRPAERIKLFGARALAAAGIIENSVGGLDAFAKSISENVGRAAEIGAARLEGFDGAAKLLKSAMEGLGLAIAQSGVLDFFTRLVEKVTVVIRWMAALPKPILATIGVILTLGSALAAILVPLGLIAVGLSTLAPLFAPGALFAGVGVAASAVGAAFAALIIPVTLLVAAYLLLKDISFDLGGETVTLGNLVAEMGDSIVALGKEASLSWTLMKDSFNDMSSDISEESSGILDNLPSFNDFVASGIASFEIFGRVVAAVFVRIGKGLGGFASDLVDAFNSVPEAIKAAFDGDEATSAGEIIGSKFKNGFVKQFEGLSDEISAIVADSTAKAQSALSLLGQTDFVKRAAARPTGGAPDDPAATGKIGGGVSTPPPPKDVLTTFSDQQVKAAEAVQKLVNAVTPGTDAINMMAAATTTLNDAQQLGVITGGQNVAILQQIREEGAEGFLAGINPVTAAYRDQRIALEELAVASELFNLSEQEQIIASDLIKEKTEERLLQLDQFKEKLSLVDATRMGVQNGFEEFVKGLGTSFDIVSAATQKLGNLISSSLVTAITEGKFAFKDFATAVIKLIGDMIIQLIIQIALQAALKALGGGGGGGAANGANVGSQANNLSFATPGMAEGGPISGSVGQTFLVGEEGPELFVPKSTGDIVPNKQSAAMMQQKEAPPPVVNVSVVNVSDPNEVPDGMASSAGEKVIMNTVQKNAGVLKGIL